MKKTIDMDNPKDARKFLRGIRIQGKAIEFVILADGSKLSVEKMTDAEVCCYAKDVYLDYCGGIEGEGGFVELIGVDQ